MTIAEPTIPARFAAAYTAVAALADVDRYLGAFIFGSVARGTATAQSDFDVRVLIDQDNTCRNINHPVIGGVKLDLTFISFIQLQHDTAQEIARATRLPMITESIIIFDKTGALGELRDEARRLTPPAGNAKRLSVAPFSGQAHRQQSHTRSRHRSVGGPLCHAPRAGGTPRHRPPPTRSVGGQQQTTPR